jgi:hypothetical protein
MSGLLDAVNGSWDYAYRTCPHRNEAQGTCRNCLARAAVEAVAAWLDAHPDETLGYPARVLRAEVAPPRPTPEAVIGDTYAAWCERGESGYLSEVIAAALRDAGMLREDACSLCGSVGTVHLISCGTQDTP